MFGGLQSLQIVFCEGKSKGKIHPITGHEDPEIE